MGASLRSSGFFEIEDGPDTAPPPHSERCDVHRIDYRAAQCPRCLDAARERRCEARLAAEREKLTPRARHAQAMVKRTLTAEQRALIGRRSAEARWKNKMLRAFGALNEGGP